jgi:hypothetical protein
LVGFSDVPMGAMCYASNASSRQRTVGDIMLNMHIPRQVVQASKTFAKSDYSAWSLLIVAIAAAGLIACLFFHR